MGSDRGIAILSGTFCCLRWVLVWPMHFLPVVQRWCLGAWSLAAPENALLHNEKKHRWFRVNTSQLCGDDKKLSYPGCLLTNPCAMQRYDLDRLEVTNMLTGHWNSLANFSVDLVSGRPVDAARQTAALRSLGALGKL